MDLAEKALVELAAHERECTQRYAAIEQRFTDVGDRMSRLEGWMKWAIGLTVGMYPFLLGLFWAIGK
jgi:hypothetical protein